MQIYSYPPSYFFTFIIILFSSICSAQEIHIQLQTEEEESVNFALVSLLNLDKQAIQSQNFPNEDGKIHFDQLENGNYSIVIEGGLGFEPYQSEVLNISQQTPNIDLGLITLKYKSIEGDEVVVTAKRYPILYEIDVDKSTLNVEGSSLSNLPSIDNILVLSPEVSVEGDKLSVAGKSNILVLINGKISNIPLSSIAPSTIKSIEIISNPSAEFDASVEAVINVVLKKGSLQGFQANNYLKYTQGLFPRTNIGSSLFFNSGKWSSNLTVDYNYKNTLSRTFASRTFTTSTTPYYSNTELEAQNQTHNFFINGGLDYQITPKHNLGFRGEYSLLRTPENRTTQVDQFKSTNQVDSLAENNTFSQSSTNNYQFQLNYNGSLGKQLKISSAVSYTKIQPQNSNDYSFTISDNNLNLAYAMQDSIRAHIGIAQVDASWNKQQHRLDFGLKYTLYNTWYRLAFQEQTGQALGIDNSFDYQDDIYAAYLQWKSQWKTLTWRLGIRTEFNQTQGMDQQQFAINTQNINFFPSAVLLWVPSNDHVLRFNYNSSIQRVNFFNQSPYQYYTSLFTLFEGNPNLRPQLTHSLQLIYYLKNQFVFNLYYNHQKDYIFQISERYASLERFQNINIQNQNFGISFSTELALKKWWKIQLKAEAKGILSQGQVQGNSFNTKSIYTNIYLQQSFHLWNWMHADLICSYRSPYAVGIYTTQHLFYCDLNLSKNFFNDQLTVAVYARDLFGTNIERNAVDFDIQNMQAEHIRDVRTIGISLLYNIQKGRETSLDDIETLQGENLQRIEK